MENVNIKKWLEDNPKSSGYDDGFGYSDSDGYGSSFYSVSGYISGDGYGDGAGSGSGAGYGYDYGSGYGSGSGSSDGNGYGDGSGGGGGSSNGDGNGDGYGDGIKTFGNDTVYMIDGLQTIIRQMKGQVAKGFILNKDFTLNPCYVVKGNGYFAHGKDIREAQSSLREKIFEDMDSDEAIKQFMSEFKKGKSYLGTEFFEWHHYLTGSCLMGRESFVKNHSLDLNAKYTVEEFIELTENDYGSSVIKTLKEKWNS